MAEVQSAGGTIACQNVGSVFIEDSFMLTFKPKDILKCGNRLSAAT